MSSPGSRRSLRRGLVAVAVLLVGMGGAVAVLLLHAPGNVSHPNVEFTRPSATPPPKPVAVFAWPRYGYDAARTRDLDPPDSIVPPFRVGWRFNDFALLEFPPVIYGNTLYVVDDTGSAKAIDALTGHKLWETKVGTLAAASPALGVAQGLLYVPILSTNHSIGKTAAPGNGRFVALSMRTGHVVWSMKIPPGTESSPLAWQNSVYFGDQNGVVYSLNATTGHLNWTYHAAGAVKGGPALAYRRLYFGDYAGRVYALDPVTGHPIWAVNTGGTDFGFGSGNFYSTPAVAFGRVYMGNTDGRVYSFAARTGQLAWATSTGAYVYASPAVADVPGIGPTVYEGSYDGNLYAFNAQSGAIRWRHFAGGKISGSATVVGHIVYFSDLGTKTTEGLNARTGRRVFFFRDGAFNPVVANYSTIFMTGYTTLYEMIPKQRPDQAQIGASGPTGASGASARTSHGRKRRT
jgi:outer membrane protein assembly factor BamB